jgi:hypothetical protein
VHEAGTVPSKLIATGGAFISATPNGSRVFYATGEPVSSQHFAVGAEFRRGDLYEYDVDSEQTRDVSEGETYGFIGASEDGETVYFVSPKLLAFNENAQHIKAVEGEDNVFVSEPVVGHPGKYVTRFVVTLARSDNDPASQILFAGVPLSLADWAPTVAIRSAQVSPNGQYLAFGSSLGLTPMAQNSAVEIYRFDLADEELACASCAPSGTSDSGAWPFPSLDGFGTRVQRYMLDNGDLFFTTADALVPQDVNGQDDVYEYQDGAPHLISGGVSEAQSVFLGASEDGRDAYFTTAQPLVGQDQDGIVDVYDARVEGGFPGPVPPPECASTQECHGSLVGSPPSYAPPPSASLSGAGDLAPPPPPAVVKPKVQTRAQKLAKVLRACRRKRPGRRRAICERLARKSYAAKASAKPKKMGGR